MHLLMQNEFDQALLMMKYSVNHPWKFRSWSMAFLTGFLQCSISVAIEVSNTYIVLANSSTQFDIIADFIIMLVIADFDNYFYAMRRDDPISQFNNDENYSSLLKWETTTSYDSCAKIPGNELKPEMILMQNETHLRPKYIYMSFFDRSFWNATLYCVYRFFQLMYNSFYYYFMPFIATFVVWLILISANERVAAKDPVPVTLL